MKITISILFILLNLNLYGQNLNKKVGQIEVQLIKHNFLRNSDYELTKKITNRKNRPFLKLYFDSSGTLLKTISFGKQHNTDLRLLNKIKLFNYKDGKLFECIEYESDYNKNIYPYWKTKYIYNNKEELIAESEYSFDNDSMFFKTTYEYDKNHNLIKSIFNPTYYYQRDFDSNGQITSLKQILDNKIRWEWKYTYTENRRVGTFQTYYHNGKDYSKEENQIFDNKGFLIVKEERYISQNGLNEKQKFFYDKNGVINRIEYFESFSNKEEYTQISYTEVEIKSKVEINLDTALKINKTINTE